MAMLQFYVGKWAGVRTSMHGYVIAGPDGLRFTLHDGVVDRSVLDEDTETVELPWSDVATLAVDHDLLESSLIIGLHTPPVAKKLPGLKGNTITLKTPRKSRDALDAFLESAGSFQRGDTLTDVDAVLDDLSEFLDGI